MSSKAEETKQAPGYAVEDGVEAGHVINASGHVQELDRNFGFLSICSVGIVTGNAWCAIGGSIVRSSTAPSPTHRLISYTQVVAIYNGGPPGVLYEFIAVSFFYWLIAACIAELASAIPSSAGVYHWCGVTFGVSPMLLLRVS